MYCTAQQAVYNGLHVSSRSYCASRGHYNISDKTYAKAADRLYDDYFCATREKSCHVTDATKRLSSVIALTRPTRCEPAVSRRHLHPSARSRCHAHVLSRLLPTRASRRTAFHQAPACRHCESRPERSALRQTG